ncbi:hypothetical protein GGR52DRAFT_567709 [Hypoxylon sp. FL1284]|nr:hypothetical protein GGR52DRAFT_567709 [Hypoxylon sp. FL1284]
MKSDEYGWVEHWGMRFKWTPEHLTPEELQPLKHTYDTVATDAVERLEEILSSSCTNNLPREDGDTPPVENKPRRDLYELVQKHAATDEKIGRLWTEVNTVPDWVDWEQIERGQKVFYRYGGAAITALTFLSLLGGMGSGRTVETLDRTGGFGADVVRRRLLETTQHTLNVTRDLPSIQPGGDGAGFADSVRVRLLHATVRRRIQRMAAADPAYYSVAAYGAPVSDLDCIGTINAFSAAVVWMGLPRQGILLRAQEAADYLALWRWVAHVMGAPHGWMATPASARRMMESLLVAEIRPTAASARLANNIIAGLERQPPTYASAAFLRAQAHWLNGRELAGALGVPRPGLFYFALVLGQCLLFVAVSYVNRNVAYLDERNIKLVRKALYKVLLYDKSKGGLGYTTRFNFKYLPSFDRPTTKRGAAQPPPPGSGAPRKNQLGRIERTALVSLLTFATFAGASAWCLVSVARWLVS